ncbi:MAG TPA: hypothetical protein VFU49_03345 [Ktedonobacteraceae bacterium]|nr:hypothetical protein [Ktedonobacteraceae bacterium]
MARTHAKLAVKKKIPPGKSFVKKLVRSRQTFEHQAWFGDRQGFAVFAGSRLASGGEDSLRTDKLAARPIYCLSFSKSLHSLKREHFSKALWDDQNCRTGAKADALQACRYEKRDCPRRFPKDDREGKLQSPAGIGCSFAWTPLPML